ncbi:TonB-dependent siderophore receptor [Rhodopseudomonas sp. P2A-2r]|uniref:TonB-dependent receptor n=1 Tax=Rhodopseudomonas sp. P2A-2r TaxID=2991972 RepID=UPI0022346638|nr:TonB-dependent siderophore receptor [Rhodopseudomonas sp. P2A-2r]UZE47154.1 TonB-dependent siderophore receptor [Rhodopseudomonas sp. P2A-2r]
MPYVIPATGNLGAIPPSYAGGQVATGGQVGLLGNRSVMNTPFNLTSYTRELVENNQARTLPDVLVSDPSVGSALPRNIGREQPMIRGFLLGNTSVGFNGYFGLIGNHNFNVLDAVERVEVIKGLNGLLNGQSPDDSIGGAINLILKRARNEPTAELTTSFASRGQGGAHLDVGQRYGEHKEFGIRYNGTYRDGATEVDNQSLQLNSHALALDYRGERVRVSADILYDDSRADGLSARNTLNNSLMRVPGAPNGTNFWNPIWTGISGWNGTALLQAEVDVTDWLTVYGGGGYFENSITSRISNPTIANAFGDTTATPFSSLQERKNHTEQAGFRIAVDTGPIHHDINFNTSLWTGEIANSRTTGTPVTSNIYTPRPATYQAQSLPAATKSNLNSLNSYGVADTISAWNNRVQFTVGVRRQEVEAATFDQVTGASTGSYAAGTWSPAYALVVKPLENVSVYANQIEGLQQGTIVDNTFQNQGQIFPSYKSLQREVGVKVDWGRFTTTLAAYDIAQPAQISLPGTPLPTFSIDGENRNRGVEINTFGELTAGWRLLGGASFMDARQSKTQNGINDGKRSIGIPDVQVSLGTEWDTPFVTGLTLTGRAIHFGDAYPDAANKFVIPAWTRFDLGARYSFASPWNGKPITIRFAVENVADNNYWMTSGAERQIYLGAPRTYLASTTFRF